MEKENGQEETDERRNEKLMIKEDRSREVERIKREDKEKKE